MTRIELVSENCLPSVSPSAADTLNSRNDLLSAKYHYSSFINPVPKVKAFQRLVLPDF